MSVWYTASRGIVNEQEMGSEKEDFELCGARVAGLGDLQPEGTENGDRHSKRSLEELFKGENGSQLKMVDVRSLPSLSLKQRKKLPNSRAVYFVCREDGELLYVGMTESLVLRWLNHHRLREFQELQGLRIAWLIWEDAESLALAENFFIANLKPLFNKPIVNTRSIKSHNPMQTCSDKPLTKEEFLKLSYSELKRRTNVEPPNWSVWFNHKQIPEPDTLERLAKELGMPTGEFVEAFLEKRSRTMASKEVSKSA